MALGTYTLPNLIQGVSQQSAEQRRATQMEAEANCINSAKDGLLARNGFHVQKVTTLGGDHATAAFHEIFRGADEHYLVVVPHSNTAGLIRVFDVANNYAECTVNGTLGAADAYLATTSAILPRDAISFQTAGDHTFIANRAISPAMTSTVQSTRPPEALIFVKAGDYLHTYQVTIVYAGNKYVWSYKTPDNSVAANAAYISSSQIAATFYRAMTGGAAGIPVTGAADDGMGVGAMFVGDPGGTSGSVVVGGTTATSLGFTVELRGNVIRISRQSDANAFSIDCGDSIGNTFIVAIKDRVRSLDELPEKAFVGVRFMVSGASKDTATDYYVEFADGDIWQECTGAGTHTTFDAAKMPHALINTGVGTFTFGTLTWSTRVVGDETSDPPKYFIGDYIWALFFHQERLGILTEGAYDISKARNSFSFHRDTMQTVLASDPISSPVNGANSVSLLRRTVMIDESLYLWSQKAQYRVVGGTDGFRPESVENKPSSAFEFAEACQPVASGPSVYFATDGEQWATIRNVVYSGGKASQAIDITAHVPELIPTGIFWLNVSDTLGMLFALEVSARNIWHYSYIVQGNEIVQSAWNQWQFPPLANVQWCSEYLSNLNVAAIQLGGSGATQLVMGHVPLKNTSVDPGGEYTTRLDYRVDETQCTVVFGAGSTDITLPYDLPTTDLADMRVAIRTTGGAYTRGETIPVTSQPATNKIRVSGDLSAAQFYVGVFINSFATLSQFYVRPDTMTGKGTGAADFSDDITVLRLYVSHKDSYAYTVQIRDMTGTVIDSTSINSTDPLLADTGTVEVPVQARATDFQAVILNTSIFPSAWERVKIAYQSVEHFESSGRANNAGAQAVNALRSKVDLLDRKIASMATQLRGRR